MSLSTFCLSRSSANKVRTQPADLDSADQLHASMDACRSRTNADDRLPLASLGPSLADTSPEWFKSTTSCASALSRRYAADESVLAQQDAVIDVVSDFFGEVRVRHELEHLEGSLIAHQAPVGGHKLGTLRLVDNDLLMPHHVD